MENGHKISNGAMKRANRNVKDIIRISNSIRGFERFRNVVMYIYNNNSPIINKIYNYKIVWKKSV